MAKYKAWKDFDRGWLSANVPRFTPTGFQKVKLPESLHKAVTDAYLRGRSFSRPEMSQPAFGMNCNTGYDNDDWVVNPDYDVLKSVENFIMKELQKWTGQNVNEKTAVYGIREYHRG